MINADAIATIVAPFLLGAVIVFAAVWYMSKRNAETLDQYKARIETLERQLAEHLQQASVQVENRFTTLEAGQTHINEKLDAIEDKFDKRIDSLKDDVREGFREVKQEIVNHRS